MAENMYGKSWVLGSVKANGDFGVISVFDVSQYSGYDKAYAAAQKARDGWGDYFTRVYPGETLVIRMVNATRCDAVVNKAVT